jgi:SHAQKYF class myb-like DNA-binding protein
MVKKIKFFCSLQKQENKKQGRWSQEEQDRFLKGCYFFKNDWEKIKDYIKTRTVPQIRSHAQKYLIKLCRKYSIKLSKKKFSNKLSKHLDITKLPYKGKTNISNMSIYEKNILEMFNYYNREIITDEQNNLNTDNIIYSQNIIDNGKKDFHVNNNDINNNLNILNNNDNLVTKESINNILEKGNKSKKESLTEKVNSLNSKNNDVLLSSNQHLNSFSIPFPNILPNDIKTNSNTYFPKIPKSNNLNNPLYINNNNILNMQERKQFIDYNSDIPLNFMNNFNQNRYFIHNEYEFYLMQKISYYNTLLLNTIKSNQQKNENILLLLGYNSKLNPKDNFVETNNNNGIVDRINMTHSEFLNLKN